MTNGISGKNHDKRNLYTERIQPQSLPLKQSQAPSTLHLANSDQATMTQQYTYKIYYSSRDASGIMWCPDCRAVESQSGVNFQWRRTSWVPRFCLPFIWNACWEIPEAEIIYTGQRAEWKSPRNPYRQAPWSVTSVPTILKISPEGGVVARIQDDDILNAVKMEEFLKEWSEGSARIRNRVILCHQLDLGKLLSALASSCRSELLHMCLEF